MEHNKKANVIVITTIFPPTPAVKDFSQMTDYQLYIVGDRKTPTDWKLEGVEYFSVEKQEETDYRLVKMLPYNHYCRKMIGYLKAMENGAECVIDTDDDNIPKPGWGFPKFKASYNKVSEGLGFINIYKFFTDQHIWPRGLPLNKIILEENLDYKVTELDCNVGIWQGLADGDPDVDAVYRLTSNQTCVFNDRNPIVLSRGTISPFNTQNTIICKELFPLLYLPVTVTFRFTDILRGLVAQPIMWQHGFDLGFIGATVVQDRNPHDYMKDFLSEISMYQHSEYVVETVESVLSSEDSISGNLFRAYEALVRKGVVMKDEMTALEAWLVDIKKIQ